MAERRGRGRPPHPDVLTPAEWQVLNWVRHGVNRAEIARRRGTGVDAVKYHLANITGKLGLAGSAQLRDWPGYPASSGLATKRKGSTMQSELTLGPVAQVSLNVRDMARTEAFYGKTLGLRHIFTFGDLGFFDCDGLRLYLHAKSAEAWTQGSILYFLVDDIRSAHEVLAARGVKFTGAPHLIYTDDATGVEEWMAFFEDGEGNTLALLSRVQPTSER